MTVQVRRSTIAPTGASRIASLNSLALCALHHKFFDRGVFALTDSPKVRVSERANGGGIFDHLVLGFNGQEIHLP